MCSLHDQYPSKPCQFVCLFLHPDRPLSRRGEACRLFSEGYDPRHTMLRAVRATLPRNDEAVAECHAIQTVATAEQEIRSSPHPWPFLHFHLGCICAVAAVPMVYVF